MNTRLKKLLKMLLNSKRLITIDKIAKSLGVSNKTIRNDLDKLNNCIEKEGLLLVRKRGVGVGIEGSDEIKVLFLKNIDDKDIIYIEPFSPKQRKAYILKKLLLAEEDVVPKDLAKELYVSVNTIYKDLNKVEKWLKEHKLNLYRKRSYIEIIGDEEDYRKAFSCFMSKIKEFDEFKKLEDIFQYDNDSRIDESTLKQLKTIVELDYKRIEKLLEVLEKELSFKFSQEAFINLIIHMVISIKRLQEGKDIIMSSTILNSINYTEEFKCTQKMCKEMEKLSGIKVPESEIGYITLHILGSKVYEKELEDFNFHFEESNELELPMMISREIIKIASNALMIDLTKDEKFLNGLVLHLRPTINRLKYGLTLKNPILDEIKENYPEIYGVSWMTSVVFEKYLGVKIPESEIGYIAIHIGAAVERNKEKIRTLVVCHTGIGTSQLLLAKLRRRFPELEIIGVKSSTKLNNSALDNINLIVSTVPIQVNKSLLTVSSMLNEHDVNEIESFISGYYNITYNEEEPLSKEIFFRTYKFKDKEDILLETCKTLKERQYLKSGFGETVIERERIIPTEVGMNFSIPHGDPRKVKRSCISLTVLRHPIRWEYEDVQFILMVCLTEDDLYRGQPIFRNLSKLMDKDEFFEGLKSGHDSAKKMLSKLEFN